MGKKIDILLKKKGWTGEEVGRALIASLVHDIKSRGDKDRAPLFEEKDFRKMEEGLRDSQTQGKIYGTFVSLYGGLVTLGNWMQGQRQQFGHGFYRYAGAIGDVRAAEEAAQELRHHPLVMTEEQYQRTEQLAKEDLRSHTSTYSDMVRNVVVHYLLINDDPAQIPGEIREALDECRRQRVTNKRILDNFNIDTGNGYYEGGKAWTEADDSSFVDEDIRKALENAMPNMPEEEVRAVARQYQIYRIAFKGVEGIQDRMLAMTGEPMKKEVASSVYRQLMSALGGDDDDEDEDESVENIELASRIILNRELSHWHFYDPSPELTKYDVLNQDIDRYFEGYGIRFDSKSGEDVKEVTPAKQYKEFLKDYPKLAAAVRAHIAEKISVAAEDMDKNATTKTIATWGELADLGIPAYIDLTEVYDSDIIKMHASLHEKSGYMDQIRANANGIAILKHPGAHEVDENGDYIETPITVLTDSRIEAVARAEAKTQQLHQCLGLITTSLENLYACDALIDIIKEVFGLPDLEIMKSFSAIPEAENRVMSLNLLLYVLFATVKGDSERRKEARELLRSTFQDIDMDSLKPLPEAIEAVREEIQNIRSSYGTFHRVEQLLPLLRKLIRGEGHHGI